MRIKGTVSCEVIHASNISVYSLCSPHRNYVVVSRGRQAIKDYLFIKEDQIMEIEGEEIGQIFFCERSIIKLKSRENYNEN